MSEENDSKNFVAKARPLNTIDFLRNHVCFTNRDVKKILNLFWESRSVLELEKMIYGKQSDDSWKFSCDLWQTSII